jgi:glycosyltransferase involved in cell wall biosynthesis
VPDGRLVPATIELVMPVYNGARHLQAALDSIAAQQDPDWRLLAIDDAGTDGSLEMLRRLSAIDTRVRVVRNRTNLGLYGTLAAGVDLATSDWVGVLMQDDCLKPDYVGEMRRLIATHPAAEAIWATEDVIDADGRLVRRGLDTSRLEPIPPGPAPWRHALRQGCLWTISGSLTRRRLLLDVRLRTDLPHCGDYDWFLRAVRDRPFLYYERPLTDLRQHAGQSSAENLRTGQDLRESLAIVHEQVRQHAADLTVGQGVVIATTRVRGLGRRLAAAVRHGRIRQVPELVRQIGAYASLPARLLFRRATSRPERQVGH